MGLPGEIAASLMEPLVLLTGLIVGILLLSQSTDTAVRVFIALAVWDLLVLSGKYQLEATAHKLGPMDPASLPPGQVSWAASHLTAALIAALTVYAVGGLVRLLKTQPHGG